ncbi:MAG: hypothetical protein IPP83_09275 [Flavobacteriales bacterium]|nr:hypothetical protein [Flavobacteriales bacterium]
MSNADRFPDLASVRAERVRLQAVRSTYADGLQGTLDLLKDKEYRRALVLDGIGDAIGAPTLLGVLAKGVAGSRGWLPFIAPLLAGRKGILGSRLFWTVLGFALPAVVSKNGEFDLHAIRDGLRSIWSRIRERFAASEDEAAAEEEEEPEDMEEMEVNER